MKQLSNLNTGRFQDPTYRQGFAATIYRNIFDGIFLILDVHPGLLSPEEKNLLKQSSASTVLPKKAALIVVKLLRENKELIDSTVPNLQDCFKHYAAKLYKVLANGENSRFDSSVFCGPDFIPEVEDCVRARVRTSGIVKQEFNIQGTKFCFMDVGGQRAERRKWFVFSLLCYNTNLNTFRRIHQFEDITALLFVCAASEYDVNLFEDPTTNRLQDSLDLFSQICTSEYLKAKPVLLYLNKRDLLVEKLKHVPLNISGMFPNAPRTTDLQVAVKWLTHEFEKRKSPQSAMYTHLTCATDAANVAQVFDASKAVILKQMLQGARFM